MSDWKKRGVSNVSQTELGWSWKERGMSFHGSDPPSESVRDDPLTEANFYDFCMQHYEDYNIMKMLDFDEDIARIGYIKKLLTRYQKTGELKERLILNHIIILGNVFRPENAVRLLFLKIEESQWCVLKPFFEYLHYLPKVVEGLANPILTEDIATDEKIMEALKKL